jgi:hypothetical protein
MHALPCTISASAYVTGHGLLRGAHAALAHACSGGVGFWVHRAGRAARLHAGTGCGTAAGSEVVIRFTMQRAASAPDWGRGVGTCRLNWDWSTCNHGPLPFITHADAPMNAYSRCMLPVVAACWLAAAVQSCYMRATWLCGDSVQAEKSGPEQGGRWRWAAS